MSLDGMDAARLRDEMAALEQPHAEGCPNAAHSYSWRCGCLVPAASRCRGCGITVLRSSDNETGHCTGCARKAA